MRFRKYEDVPKKCAIDTQDTELKWSQSEFLCNNYVKVEGAIDSNGMFIATKVELKPWSLL